jgi:predicted DNA-binding protein YlxM (UPF0122 family)
MTAKRELVIEILKAYPYKKRRIDQLRFELAHPAEIGGEELIAGLALGAGAPAGNGVKSGMISNRTMMIAMRYGDTVKQMNTDTVMQISRELCELEGEIERIEHYVSILPEYQAKLIRRHYFDSLTWNELEDEFGMTKRSLFNHQNAALDELASMYDFISKLKNKGIAEE